MLLQESATSCMGGHCRRGKQIVWQCGSGRMAILNEARSNRFLDPARH
jgi:hypothetical protein